MYINFNPIKLYSNKIYTQKKVYNNKYPNLAPLKQDTVSFGAGNKLHSSDMSNSPSMRDCYLVAQNAEPSRYYLQKVLDKYLKPFIRSDENSTKSKKPVCEYYTRTKSANSIREKVVSKYSKINSEETEKFCNQTIEELLNYFPLTKGITKEFATIAAQRAFTGYSSKIPPYENVAFSFNEILNILKSYNLLNFQVLNDNEQNNAFSKIIEHIEKSSFDDDIAENSEGNYINPQTITGIKHYANDIVGARIILGESGPEDTVVILKALKRAVDDGCIKITSIENNELDPDMLADGKSVEDYAYVTHKKLQHFSNETDSKLIDHKSKSGYLAIHINLEFPDPILSARNSEFKGYSGEIQIIGRDVERLKDIEDLCYKIKDNKNAIHDAYSPFRDYFLKYYTGKTKEEFDKYTYALYLAQRELKSNPNEEIPFPSVKDLGFEGKVPEELDFNILKGLKEFCYKDYINQTQANDEREADIFRTKYSKNQDKIAVLKEKIDNKFS